MRYIYTGDYDDGPEGDYPVQHIAHYSDKSPSAVRIHSQDHSSRDSGDPGEHITKWLEDLNTSTKASPDNLHTTNPAHFTNSLVYALADQYDMPALKTLAAWKFAKMY